MDDFDIDNLDISSSDNDEPDNLVPLEDDDADKSGISHAPLTLGGGSAEQVPKAKPIPKVPRPVRTKVTKEAASSAERVTGVRTFFTKLHAGAIEFLDEQISDWLKVNPDISIKLTNTTTGDVQGKKTEPNIIITVWY